MIVVNKTELEKLKLKIGQKIDLFLKEKSLSPRNIINVVFDGIKEYDSYGVSDVYILYHRAEAANLKDIRGIDVVTQEGKSESSDVDRVNTTDNTSVVTESPTEEQNKTPKKYECSCGKVYSHYASWYQHAKKTGHVKKVYYIA